MTMWWLAWAMLGCGTPDPVQTTDGPIEAPDAEWMVTVSATAQRMPPQTWTAWRTGDGVEAAAGKGAVQVSGDEIEQLEQALQAFEEQESRPGVDDDAGAVSWTVIVERGGGDRVEHSGLALEGPTAELVSAVAIAADHDGSGVLPVRAP